MRRSERLGSKGQDKGWLMRGREVFTLVLEERKEGRGRVLQRWFVRFGGFWTKEVRPTSRSEAYPGGGTALEADLEHLKSVEETALLTRWASSELDVQIACRLDSVNGGIDCRLFHTMATRGRRGVGPTRGDELAGGSQSLAQQAQDQTGVPLPPPPPLVDYGALMQGLVHAMQTQAQTTAALQAQVQVQERADVWWSSVLRTQFGDGVMEVAWAEFVRLFRAKYIPEHVQDRMELKFLILTQGLMSVLEYEARFVELSKYASHIVADERRKVKKFIMGLKPSLRTRLVALEHRSLEEALSAACMQEAEMEVYLEEKRASLKRPALAFQRQNRKMEEKRASLKRLALAFQRQDRKKKAPAFQQRAVVPARVVALTPGGGIVVEKPVCTQCGKRHGGEVCWVTSGRCLRCGDKNHKIRDCPKMAQQTAAAAAPAAARPTPRAVGRLRAQA
ncbi:hypothetical protein Taro_021233 [Colocasia esculenta]|uniref:CCHC-type domain-containing protein n=1 Tax=Colocasia esculenta TaxID=4460 RepID=A0A843VAW2_COLES|nr:hypothetical protein [Colocasia esculenta]